MCPSKKFNNGGHPPFPAVSCQAMAVLSKTVQRLCLRKGCRSERKIREVTTLSTNQRAAVGLAPLLCHEVSVVGIRACTIYILYICCMYMCLGQIMMAFIYLFCDFCHFWSSINFFSTNTYRNSSDEWNFW